MEKDTDGVKWYKGRGIGVEFFERLAPESGFSASYRIITRDDQEGWKEIGPTPTPGGPFPSRKAAHEAATQEGKKKIDELACETAVAGRENSG